MINFEYNPKKEKELTDWYVEKLNSVPSVLELKEYNKAVAIDKNSDFIKKHTAWIETHWKSLEENFIHHLSNFYEKDLVMDDITCYLVRIHRFPYDYKNDANPKWFAAPLFDQPASRVRVIMHELVHYFQPVELPYDIKESIPVILNDHNKFNMWSFDQGNQNENEQRYRNIVWQIYSGGGKFKDVLKTLEKMV